ncbi:MAG: ADP-ribosylglycohydrolase family protein [Candidatus Hodarchaeota archaeon]
MNLESKFLGGMVGSALGDCIGELAFDYRSGASLLQIVNEIPLLVYTDDTAMAIGIAQSLTTIGKIDCQHLGTTFRTNFIKEPYRGYAIGPPTIFSKVQSGMSYTQAAQSLFRGTGSFGNGAAMRITPLGLFLYDSSDLYEKVRRSAIVTHAHPLGIEGAALLARAIALVVPRVPEEEGDANEWTGFLDEIHNFVQTEEYNQQIQQIKKLLAEKASLKSAARKLGTNVTALQSVPFSIFAFLKNPYSFDKCLFDSVLVGGDRDTIGAMVGGLLGAHLGIEAIPMKWREKLENRQIIEALANKLVELLKKS